MGICISSKHSDDPLILLAYNPKKKANFTFCSTHRVYTNDKTRVNSLPPPHPPPSKKREIFNPKTYAYVDKRVKNLYTDLHRPINELVHLLTGDYDSEIAKVRALYQWFTLQPVETSDYVKAKRTSTMYQLWHLKNKYINYADFFSILCWFARIPCVVIRGYLKGSTYQVGQAMSRDSHVGEWNAVLIGGHWRLLDAFWGSCIVLNNEEENDPKEKFIYQADASFFLTDPENLIYSHFPDEAAWQLLKEEKSLEEFESLAVLKERFFSFKMEPLSHFYNTIEAEKGKIAIYFILHPLKSTKQSFMCIPTYMDDGQDKDRQGRKRVKIPKDNVVLLVRQNGKRKELAVHVKFPVTGTYKLDILGKNTEKLTDGYDYDWIAVYKVIVKDAAETKAKLENSGFGPGENLKHLGLAAVSHLKGVIQTSPGPLELQFQIADSTKFNNASVSAQMFLLKYKNDPPISSTDFEQQGKILKTVIQVEEGVFKAAVVYKAANGEELYICNYHVICWPHPKPKKAPVKPPTPKDDIEELRKRLQAAMADEDVEALESAIKEAESNGYEHRLEPDLREAKLLLIKLLRLRKAVNEVMKLDGRTFAEIKSYTRPLPEIHRVMQATLMLLGHTEEETKQWKNIQSLIGKTGKLSLKRRIKELDLNSLDPKLVERSKALMAGVELRQIVQYSLGVATFYSWSKEVAEHAGAED